MGVHRTPACDGPEGASGEDPVGGPLEVQHALAWPFFLSCCISHFNDVTMAAYVTDDDGGNIEHFLKNKKETNTNMSA